MFICAIHGKYLSSNNNNECPSCANKQPSTINQIRKHFISNANKIHKRLYDYSKFVFVDFITAGTIICKTHGAFEQSPTVHINHKAKCPKCIGSISKGEIEWLNEMEKIIGKKIERNGMLIIGNRSFRPDGIDRENKKIYEYNGDFFHGNPNFYNAKDKNPIAKKTFGKLYQETLKREAIFIKAGYKVISIWESDYKEIKKVRDNKKNKK